MKDILIEFLIKNKEYCPIIRKENTYNITISKEIPYTNKVFNIEDGTIFLFGNKFTIENNIIEFDTIYFNSTVTTAFGVQLKTEKHKIQLTDDEITYLILLYILSIIHFFGSLSFASISIQSFPLVLTVIIYIYLFWLVFGKNKNAS